MLAGKVVVITGAASGIGRATCLLARDEGARGIVATDRDGDGLSALETELQAGGGHVAPVRRRLCGGGPPARTLRAGTPAPRRSVSPRHTEREPGRRPP